MRIPGPCPGDAGSIPAPATIVAAAEESGVGDVAGEELQAGRRRFLPPRDTCLPAVWDSPCGAHVRGAVSSLGSPDGPRAGHREARVPGEPFESARPGAGRWHRRAPRGAGLPSFAEERFGEVRPSGKACPFAVSETGETASISREPAWDAHVNRGNGERTVNEMNPGTVIGLCAVAVALGLLLVRLADKRESERKRAAKEAERLWTRWQDLRRGGSK